MEEGGGVERKGPKTGFKGKIEKRGGPRNEVKSHFLNRGGGSYVRK